MSLIQDSPEILPRSFHCSPPSSHTVPCDHAMAMMALDGGFCILLYDRSHHSDAKDIVYRIQPGTQSIWITPSARTENEDFPSILLCLGEGRWNRRKECWKAIAYVHRTSTTRLEHTFTAGRTRRFGGLRTGGRLVSFLQRTQRHSPPALVAILLIESSASPMART